MQYKAIVFDMDGTLLNTLDDLADSMNRALVRLDVPTHPVAAYRDFVGSGVRTLVQRVLPQDLRADTAKNKACLQAFVEEYQAGWNIKTKLYAGISELLDTLIAKKLPMAVLTNKPQDFAEHCMREFLSAWTFAATMGQDLDGPVKPDPVFSRALLTKLDLAPQEVLYLGDTDVDMQTAVNAGMYALGVLWGFRPKTELVAAGAAATISHPREVLKFLE